MSKKILVYAQDPGGSKAILPVVLKLIKKREINLSIVTHLYATQIFKKKGLETYELKHLVHRTPVTEDDAVDILKKFNPDILFCTTSNNKYDPSNGNFIRAARKYNIPSFGIFDHWKGWDRLSKRDDYTYFLPDILGVIDDYCKDYGISLGISPKHFEIVGHPYLEEIFYNYKIVPLKLRKKYGFPKNVILCTFFSQPIIEENDGKTTFKSLLSKEKEFLLQIYKICKEKLKTKGRPVLFCVKRHPKERDIPFSIINRELPFIIIDDAIESLELARLSNLVLGIDSMILYESYFCQCNIIALKFDNFSIFGENYKLSPRFLPEVSDEKNLHLMLEKIKGSILNNSQQEIREYPLLKGSVRKCEKVIEKLII